MNDDSGFSRSQGVGSTGSSRLETATSEGKVSSTVASTNMAKDKDTFVAVPTTSRSDSVIYWPSEVKLKVYSFCNRTLNAPQTFEESLPDSGCGFCDCCGKLGPVTHFDDGMVGRVCSELLDESNDDDE